MASDPSSRLRARVGGMRPGETPRDLDDDEGTESGAEIEAEEDADEGEAAGDEEVPAGADAHFPSFKIHADPALSATIRDLFTQARREKAALLPKWKKNYNILHNRMWGDRPDYLPTPELAEIYPIVTSMTGWMTDQRPSFDIAPSASPLGPTYSYQSSLALDLSNVLRSVSTVHDFDQVFAAVIWDANVYGTGFTKTVWDPSLVGGLGDANVFRVDPFTFYPDPKAKSLKDALYLCEVRTMSLQQVDARFPGAWDVIRGQGFNEDALEAPTQTSGHVGRQPMANPGAISPATTPRYGLPGQTDRGDVTDDPGVTVIECWIREHEHEDGALIESWRCVVVTGNYILLDCKATEMWSHGQHPYDRHVNVEEGEFWGTSLVELLTPAQQSINRILSAMEQNINLMGNPVLINEARSGISRTQVTNRAGTRLDVNNGAKVEWMNPPQMHPQASSDLIRFYKGEMENISGLSAITRGFMPTGRNAQGVMDSVAESAFVRVRLALRNFEILLKGVFTKTAALSCEFYDVPRVVAIIGNEGTQHALAIRSMHFYLPTDEGQLPMDFQLVVDSGSSLATSREARESMAMRLAALGLIDGEAVLDLINFPNRAIVVARMRELAAANGTLGQPPGKRAAAGH